MFGYSHLDRVRQAFEAQFSTDPNGLVYRKRQKGAPIRVSELERDDFVSSFSTQIRYATWAMFPALSVQLLILAWLVPHADRSSTNVAIWLVIGAVVVLFRAFFYWAWNTPARRLRDRPPEGPPLRKKEARAVALSKVTYGQLALFAAMGVAVIFAKSAQTDVFHGAGLVWLILGSVVIALAANKARRKWRADQQ